MWPFTLGNKDNFLHQKSMYYKEVRACSNETNTVLAWTAHFSVLSWQHVHISPSLGLLPAFCLCTVNLLQEFSKIVGDVCGVAIQERSLARMDLTRVIKDDNLPY